MKGYLRRAAARKQKFFKHVEKQKAEDEDNLSDVDEMEVSENMLGRLFNNKYISLKYLGSGTFSKVWLVYNVIDSKYYAMKMYYPKYQEDGEYEVKYLRRLTGSPHVVNMIDHFTFRSGDTDVNDKYKDNVSVCLIVELMGRSLMTLFNMYDKGVPMDVFKQVAYNSLLSLDNIHQAGLIHTDIKLENLMMSQLTGEVKEVVHWFDEMKPNQVYEYSIQQLIPSTWAQMSKQKQKKVKREVKVRAAKKMTRDMHKMINNHVNEMGKYKVNLDDNQQNKDIFNKIVNPDNKAEEALKNIIDLDDDDMPDLVNFNEAKQIKEDEELENKENSETKEVLHDDEVDLDLNNLRVKIADMGNACPIDNIDDDDIQIRSYRPPEVVMGELYNDKADVWSMACLFYELLTHEYLFDVDSEHDDNLDQDRLLLSEMYSALGKMPYDYCIDSERTYDLFDEKGRVKKYKKIDYNSIEDRIKEKRPDLSDEDYKFVCGLLRGMLQYEVKNRLSAKNCLTHPIFMSD